MRQQIIAACVKHLREFGYPDCNADNVLTDAIYSRFAKSMIEATIAELHISSPVAEACRKVLAEISEPAVPPRSLDERG